MDWTEIAKKVVCFASAAGVSKVVDNVIKTTTPAGLSVYGKALTAVGGFVISCMASTAADSYVRKQLDELLPSKKETPEEPKG